MGKKKTKQKEFTRVSLCTPTFNRRPFIQQMINNMLKQTYPKEYTEWIIVDDGTDPIGDLVKDIPFIKYVYSQYIHINIYIDVYNSIRLAKLSRQR